MIIIGDDLIECPTFKAIRNLEDIDNTNSFQILIVNNFDIAKHCKENNLAYLFICSSEKDAIYANSLNANYILSSDLNLSLKIQKMADNYMFDSKNMILSSKDNLNTILDSCKESETYIDGIFFDEYFQTI